MWNLALQPLKTLDLHNYNAYGRQTWQGGDLPREDCNREVTGTFN